MNPKAISKTLSGRSKTPTLQEGIKTSALALQKGTRILPMRAKSVSNNDAFSPF